MHAVRTLLLSAALAASVAAGVARAEAEPAAPGVSTPAAPERGPLDGWRHGLSVAWDVQTLWSQAGSHYTFQSVAASYVFSTARSGVFVHRNVPGPSTAACLGLR